MTHPDASRLSPAYPLVVDLDGTLVTTDSLVESVLAGLARFPVKTLAAVPSLFAGRSEFKHRVAGIDALDVRALPVRRELVDFLHDESARGRELHLVTAADQSIADAMAERTGLFASAVGSSPPENLKGSAKGRYLEERFPEGFSYAGDSRADVEVWKKAKSAVLVGASRATKREVNKLSIPVEREFEGASATFLTWLKALRAHQWTKNLLIFVPLLLSHFYVYPEAVASAVLGFVCLCMMASGTYLINDISDREADRQHPTKRLRPIASGEISVTHAIIAAGLAICGATVGAAMLSGTFLALLLLYLVTTTAYTLSLKRMPMVDIFALSFLYGLRVYMGISLIGSPPSNWLIAFSLLFFFSLSACKRHVEIVVAGQRGETGALRGRGYLPSDAPLTMAFGVGSGIIAVLVLFLYLVNDAFPAGAYRSPQWLWLVGYCVFIWLARVWFLSHRGTLDADPVAFALRDRASLLLGAIAGSMFVLAVIW